nr:hypothetical protein Iba_chr06bCG6630 [Ipomoea batatas]
MKEKKGERERIGLEGRKKGSPQAAHHPRKNDQISRETFSQSAIKLPNKNRYIELRSSIAAVSGSFFLFPPELVRILGLTPWNRYRSHRIFAKTESPERVYLLQLGIRIKDFQATSSRKFAGFHGKNQVFRLRSVHFNPNPFSAFFPRPEFSG